MKDVANRSLHPILLVMSIIFVFFIIFTYCYIIVQIVNILFIKKCSGMFMIQRITSVV